MYQKQGSLKMLDRDIASTETQVIDLENYLCNTESKIMKPTLSRDYCATQTTMRLNDLDNMSEK